MSLGEESSFGGDFGVVLAPENGYRPALLRPAGPADVGDIDARIAEGLVPPRPDYVKHPEEWRRWYDEHVRCATPGHVYFVRARGSRFCARCSVKEVP